MAKDPVCGMEVDPRTAFGSSVFKGKTYFFCSQTCKEEFDQAPEEFLEAEENEV